MPTLSLGKVRPVYRGAYNAATAYTVLDRVSFNGTIYECVQDVAAGIAPSAEGDSAFWVILGAQGAKGDKGDKGDTGMAGPQGIPGEKGADGTQGPQGPAGPQGPKGDTPPLYSGVDSTAQDVAASCKAVKTAYDKASEAAGAASAPATPDKLGVVRIGTGIGVDENGVISTEPVTVATTDTPGIVQVGAGLEVTLPAEAVEGAEPVTSGIFSLGTHASENPQDYGKGDFQFFGHVKITDNFEEESAAKDGVAISAKGVKTAWDRIMGIKNETVITTSGSWTVPETATYSITCVGGGGNGGWGGGSDYWNGGGISAFISQIAGGGGGGAGQVLQKDVALTKGDVIPVTIGGSGGGATSFGSHLSAAGGGNGGNGQTPSSSNNHARAGGGGGTSYGSAAGAGGSGGGINGNGCCAYGGSGGHGGTSQDASYGHGGNGGTGQSRNGYNAFGSTNPASGIQGCIRIRLA